MHAVKIVCMCIVCVCVLCVGGGHFLAKSNTVAMAINRKPYMYWQMNAAMETIFNEACAPSN